MIGKRFQQVVIWATTVGLMSYYLVSGGAIQPAYATTASGAFGASATLTDNQVRRGEMALVLSSTIPLAGADTLVDADGVWGATYSNVAVAPVLAEGGALTAFDATDNVYWKDTNADSIYDAGELIWLSQGVEDTDFDPVTDGDLGILGTAVAAVVTGGIELDSLAASGLLHFDDDSADGAWDSGEDIVTDINDNNVWNVADDGAIKDRDGVYGTTDLTAGSGAGTSGTSALTSFVDADDIYWFDFGADDTWVAAEDLIWLEMGGDDDGGFDPAVDGDIAIAGTSTGVINDGIGTQLVATTPTSGVMSYFDETAGGGFSIGTDDIYFESVAPDATYTTGRILDGDQLNAITITNTGTAVSTNNATPDISSLKIYLDINDDGNLDISSDTLLGTATATADLTWSLSGLTQTIATNIDRILVSALVASTATTGRTMIFEIDQLADAGATVGQFDAGETGVFFATTNDGPSDAAVTNSTTQTIYVASNNATAVTPAAPGSITVGAATDTSLTVSWTAATNAGFYRVYRSTSTSMSGPLVAETSALSYVDTGLTPGTTYYYLVQSVSSNGGLPSVNQTQVAGATTVNGQTVVTPEQPTTPTTPPTTPETSTPTGSLPTIPTNLPTTMPNAKAFDYRAQWSGQTGTISADKLAHEVSGTAGQVIDLELTMKNIGAAAWKADWTDATHWVKLGTWRPQDGTSPLYHSSWLSSNRITVTNVTVNQNGDYTFRFKIQIPSTATVGTSYNFYVRPVAEYVEWFGPTGIFWRVNVI